ncbi:hypothetical protein PHMEG_00027910 [Phytophthora megakarya]|uniref:Uncharacterized protein n=1 Tax=Phytophthora megakarya TaxID=4795 RepID=A0A225V775_9STRA|nr:hypothetical protein PHMEG_00027910 [Phytophthora megakarya]
MAAVAFAHKSVRNVRINYKTPEFEFIARGFNRTNSSVDRKQSCCSRCIANSKISEPAFGAYHEGGYRGIAHCVKATDLVLLNQYGQLTEPRFGDVRSVEIVCRSHKRDPTRQGNVIQHYRSGSNWKTLGVYLTSISCTRTISKSTVATTLRKAAKAVGADPREYSTRSLRIGGACALLNAGKSELVIKLMGRWLSWCFSVYTRLNLAYRKTSCNS